MTPQPAIQHRAMSADELSRSLYGELRRLAHWRMSRMRPGQTLQPTDLVHEAYVRLVEKQKQPWNSRGHFFRAAARAMRDILVDRIRSKSARKRGGDLVRVAPEAMDFAVTLPGDKTLASVELLTLHRALEDLQQELPEHAELVLLRYFAGLTLAEIASMQKSSKTTVERRWRFTRAWLQARMPEMLAALIGT